MERNVDFNDISDGKRYSINDLVKVGCNDCKGCSQCCSGMGDSIVLTPFDVYVMTSGLNCTFEQLLATKLELGVDKGVILPHIKMQENDRCGFLNEEGRCSIHSLRPGVCRLFPLGRIYENGSFSYFLQVDECPYPNKTKVKLKKWIAVEDVAANDKFINTWHDFVKEMQEIIMANLNSENEILKKLNMIILNEFFIKKYEQDFFEEFHNRIAGIKDILPKEAL